MDRFNNSNRNLEMCVFQDISTYWENYIDSVPVESIQHLPKIRTNSFIIISLIFYIMEHHPKLLYRCLLHTA